MTNHTNNTSLKPSLRGGIEPVSSEVEIKQSASLIPKLRFKEFDGEWEEKKLESQIKNIDSGWSPQCEEYPSEEKEWGVLKTTSVVWEGFNPNANKKLPSKFEPRPELQVIANDILITRAGPTSRVGVPVHVYQVRTKLMISDKLIRIKVIQNCSSQFLTILLGNKNAQKQLISKSSGLAESQTNISQKILLKTKLFFPSIKEQKKVANFLTAVDSKLQQLTTKKEKLAQYKKGVMQQLFSQQLRFKPDVIASLSLRGGTTRQTQAISPNETEFPDWEEKKLGEVGKIITGSTPSTSIQEYYDGKKLFVSPADIQGNRYVSETKTTLTDLGFNKGRKVKKNSVLFVCIGSTIGKVAQTSEECLTNQQLNVIEANKENSNDFIYSLLNYKGDKIKLLAGVQAVPQINKTDFSNFKFQFPSLKEQQKIAIYLSAIDTKIESVQSQISNTQAFKKGLLQQMFV